MAAIIALTGICRADLLQNCGTCQGSTYLLTYNQTPVGTFGAKGKIYDVFLTIDLTNYASDQANNIPPQIFIQTVGIKIANSVVFANSSLLGAPGNVKDWELKGGGVSNSGGSADCNGSGSGFICAQAGPTAPVPFNGTYTWEFDYGTTDSLLLSSLGSSIKVAYTDGSFKKVGSIVSEGITLQDAVPDSGVTLMLLGGALVGMEIIRRRFTA